MTEPLFSLFLFFVSLCCFGCCLFAFICLFSKAYLVGSCRVFISLVVDFCLGVGTVSLVSYCVFSLYCIVPGFDSVYVFVPYYTVLSTLINVCSCCAVLVARLCSCVVVCRVVLFLNVLMFLAFCLFAVCRGVVVVYVWDLEWVVCLVNMVFY